VEAEEAEEAEESCRTVGGRFPQLPHGVLERERDARGPGEKDAQLARKLGQRQPFVDVDPQECMDQLAFFGTNLTPCSLQASVIGRAYLRGWFAFDFISSTPSSWVTFFYHIANESPAGIRDANSRGRGGARPLWPDDSRGFPPASY
jgi:hypothetical protein